METNLNYIELIARYFSGEATGAEMQALADWVKADPANRKIFDEYRLTWSKIEENLLDARIHTNHEWDKFSERIFENPSASRTFFLTPSFLQALRIAAVSLILLIPAFFLYRYFASVRTEKIYAALSMRETTLPDGTVVTLNAGSSIVFPDHFGRNSREVKLRGEAYFEVQHDSTKPFIVSSGNIRVMVLGTAFNINTHEQEGSMEVVLTRGKVAVYYTEQAEKQLIMVPGEKAEINKSQDLMRKSLNEDENYMAWKTKKLIFINKSLGIVVHDLNKVYHSDIRLMNPVLVSCRLTATFDNQTIESILNVLQSTLDIRIKREGSTVEINGHGCE